MSTPARRPAVSVVMPFAGTPAEGAAALAALSALETEPDDELILADNSGLGLGDDRVRVITVDGERSPSHARNVGAEHARGEWILFLDADCVAAPDLLVRYFAAPIPDAVGALAGEVVPAAGDGTASFAARYGAARSFLGSSLHLTHPYLPRAVAANLLVRRTAFAAIGGFYEGVRAAEDTDFSWRLQRAGWQLAPRAQAQVAHRYRASVEALRHQWRGYAAGRAWLGRRYADFAPEPALRRAGVRAVARLRPGRPARRLAPAADPTPVAPRGPEASSAPASRLERTGFAALDAVLGLEELAGLLLSNRPAGTARAPAQVVLVAERFPAPGDPLVDLARTLAGARVEAAARPEVPDPGVTRALAVDYREDDGAGARLAALGRLLARHPVRALSDGLHRRPSEPSLSALAPAVLRLTADPGARVLALGGAEARATARRLAALAGRALEEGAS